MIQYAPVEDAIQALAEGRLVIVVDSEDRENEGDFVAAATSITPESIHFMTTHGRGHFCMPLAPEIARRLELQPMVPRRSLTEPCFTIPVDHCRCKTGISPAERAETIRAMLDATSCPEDFIRPGHVFPLIAEQNGVLDREGHTEAAVDLARLAGLAPAALLCEICSRDGLHMAVGGELMELADKFRLPLVTIDDILAHRRRRESRGVDSAGRPGELAPGLISTVTA